MAKNVTSYDSRKSAIMEALKRASGGTKITNVVELESGKFAGHCMKMGRNEYGGKSYLSLGTFTVEIASMKRSKPVREGKTTRIGKLVIVEMTEAEAEAERRITFASEYERIEATAKWERLEAMGAVKSVPRPEFNPNPLKAATDPGASAGRKAAATRKAREMETSAKIAFTPISASEFRNMSPGKKAAYTRKAKLWAMTATSTTAVAA